MLFGKLNFLFSEVNLNTIFSVRVLDMNKITTTKMKE